MKRIFNLSMVVAGLAIMSACSKLDAPYLDLTDSKEGAQVSIARAAGNTLQLTVFPYADEARTLKFGASFGALGLPAQSIPVKFAIDSRALDSLNNIRTTQGLMPYVLFPEDSYTLSSTEAIIPAGQVSSDLVTVSYYSKKFDPLTDYLLPISIVKAGDYKLATNKTIFIVASKLTEKMISKTGWTAEASSEELNGEGASNGRAAQAIDGNVNTFWHSKWQNTELPFPHTLTIDMKSSVYVTRVDLAARQNASNGFRKFNIEGSDDGSSWTSLGVDLMMDPLVKSYQSYPVSPGYRRYLRLTMTTGATATTKSTNLGEISVYGY